MFKLWYLSINNPRTINWPLCGSPFPILSIIISYVYFVKVLGPQWMKNKEPFKIEKIIAAYNILMVIFSAWFFIYSKNILMRSYRQNALVLLRFASTGDKIAKIDTADAKLNIPVVSRGILTTYLVIFNHGEMTRTTLIWHPPSSPNFHNTPTGGRLSFNRFNEHRPPYTLGLQRYLAGTDDTSATSPLP
ncbi:UNVERIFIED_CONTAM: Elongation of very long chain fatty acids protein [Trichonephila clavipes]